MQTASDGMKHRLHGSLMLVSIVIGMAGSYAVFTLFLQSAIVSRLRLAMALLLLVAISGAHYLGTLALLKRWHRAAGSQLAKAVAASFLVTGLFLPLLYKTPAYPISPLLLPWSDVAVEFDAAAGSTPLQLSDTDVRLVLGRDSLNAGGFQLVGQWVKAAGGLQLSASQAGSLQWTGTVPETVNLEIQPPAASGRAIVYWDGTRTSFQLSPQSPSPILLTRKFPVPWGFNAACFVSFFILLAWAFSSTGLLLMQGHSRPARQVKPPVFTWVVILLSIVLALITVKLQVDSLDGGANYLTTTQLSRHASVLAGTAPDPWQYRVLSEWIAEAIIRVYQWLSIPAAIGSAFISLRVLQNFAIFLAAFALYRRLSGSAVLALLGGMALAASMLNAYYDNDLSFNTYFDVLFYLVCALLLLSRNYYVIVILAVFAALNRETSALMPFVMAAAILGDDARSGLKKYMPVLLSMAIFAVVFVGLRLLFPGRPLYVPYKHAPGIGLLLYNLTRTFTWQQLFSTLGLAPLLSLAFFRSWSPDWQRIFLVLCPIWFVVHSFASVMAETRLLLVPMALVFIPGVLFALRSILAQQLSPVIPLFSTVPESYEP